MYFSLYVIVLQNSVSFRKLSHLMKATHQFREDGMFVPSHRNCIFKHSSSVWWDLPFPLILLYFCSQSKWYSNKSRPKSQEKIGIPEGIMGWQPVGLSLALKRDWKISSCIFPLAATEKKLLTKFNYIVWWVVISHLNEMFPALPIIIFFLLS